MSASRKQGRDERRERERALGGEPPRDERAPAIEPRPKYATGLPAVKKAIALSLREMGVARSVRTLADVNQFDGFDCPGCAWPDPEGHRSMAEFCENGAKAVASEATRERADPAFFSRHSVAELLEKPDVWYDKAGRLTHPMVLREGATHYEPIGWEEAFALIAKELRGLASPDEAAFYTSGRTSNEAAFVYQLFVRQFGTNNLPDCSNMCHESSGTALIESIGIGKGTVTIDDFEPPNGADSIWIVGQNPGTNHPRMLSSLLRARRDGAVIVGVNPLREVGIERFAQPQEALGLLGRATQLVSLHVPVTINGDLAFFKGVMKEMVEAEDRGERVIDRAFVEGRTEGFEEFAADVRGESWERIVKGSGVGREVIREAARAAMRSKRMIVCWAMGITQHVNAVATIQTMVNFALLRGNIGRPGAGVCPVRGHSNVQGDRTMGIWEKMPQEWLDRLGREFGFTPPRGHGLDAVGSIRAMHAGRVKVFVGMGGNLLSAAPDTRFTAEAMRKCRLTAHVSTKLNRGHLVTGRTALILPCKGRTEVDRAPAPAFSLRSKAGGTPTERFVSVEDSMGKVHASRGVLEPASAELRSEVEIVCGLARAVLGSATTVDWEGMAADYDVIREHVSRVVPGFERYNERIREKGGFYVVNGPRDGVFTTPSGKARFMAHPIPERGLAADELLLTTIRTHDQFNTTVYGEDDRYRGVIGGRRVLFMSAEDMAVRGLRPGERVDIRSASDGVERIADGFMLVEYDIPRGCVAGYFPELNVLVPIGSVAEKSGQPASKSVVVRVAAGSEK